ncbi:MAG: hypothetical protein GY756_02765 [bacterium]|nr:hypothetical protein [bacterium]
MPKGKYKLNIPFIQRKSLKFMCFDEFKNKNIHFVGCSGIGMAGLAYMVLDLKNRISGSDIVYNKSSKMLERNGAKIFIGHDSTNLPYIYDPSINKNDCIIIYSSAIDKKNIEIKQVLEDEVTCYKRGEFLAKISSCYDKVISVAGSHGKTSVTALITEILNKTDKYNPGYFIGGYPNSYEKNASLGDGSIFITEADESDLSFTHLNSDLGIILNITEDHSWSIGGGKKLMDGFSEFGERSDKLLLGANNIQEEFLNRVKEKKNKIIERKTYDNLLDNKIIGFQRDNITTAVNVAEFLGINPKEALNIALNFKGVDRRMSIRYKSSDFLIIEDYAHHPLEIKNVIATVKKKYKTEVQVVFQPHRYSRFLYYFDDFCRELNEAEYIFILPVFAAWEKQNDCDSLINKFTTKLNNKSVYLNKSWNETANYILDKVKRKGVVLLFGAGDISKLIPALVINATVQ